MTHRNPPQTRNRLLSTCALAAIALGAPGAVRAQVNGGFNGTVIGAPVNATVPTGAGTIQVTGPRAIINWQANNNNDFLTAGSTATFNGNGNYIVLNRVTPVASTTTPIQLNGTVRSTLFGQQQGGDVWFYSPNGILVGATGRFDVGSLLLTANNVGDGEFRFGGADVNFTRPNSNASVAIDPGATISALGRNAYVALIAPRVRQSGSVTVNGTAAYVAAEAVTMTIRGGLVDFAVNVTRGSDGVSAADNTTLTHDGTTNMIDNDSFEDGYGNIVAGGPRNMILVAVPKNDAITMLLSGDVNYQPAAVADVVEKRILLGAGHNVSDSQTGERATSTTAVADLRIGNGLGAAAATDSIFAIDVSGVATGSVFVVARDTESSIDLSLDDGAFLRGANGVLVEALAGSTLAISDADLQVEGATTLLSAGVSLIARAGSRIDIADELELGASYDPSGQNGSPAPNLSASIVADGGTITVAGGDDGDEDPAIEVAADAGLEVDGDAGNAVGGTALMEAKAGGSITARSVLVSARYGDEEVTNGAAARGGTASLVSSGGSINISDTVTVTAAAQGGAGAAGGSAVGGTALMEAKAGGSITARSALITANAVGGDGTTGGTARGGTASLATSGGGAITISGFAEVYGSAIGGAGGTGGSAVGGTVNVASSGGLDLDFLVALTDGIGGSSESPAPGATGTGGTAVLSITGGTNRIGFAGVAAHGNGGSGGNGGFVEGAPGRDGGRGGDGIGGTVSTILSGGSLTVGQALVTALGTGGAGGLPGSGDTPGTGGRGGDARGGVATLTITNGSAVIDSLELTSSASAGSPQEFEEGGFGGNGGVGGNALAGTTTLAVSGGSLASQFVSLSADGAGGDGGTGDGGTRGGDGGRGGTGTGGRAELAATGGSVSIGGVESSISITALGVGGDGGRGGTGTDPGASGGVGAAGAAGDGGTARIGVGGGDVALSFTTLNANGFGGRGGQGGFGSDPDPIPAADGNGADATGGTALVEATAGALSAALVQADASAVGGDGGQSSLNSNGGGAIGGTAGVRAAGGTIELFEDTFIGASAVGGIGVVRGGEARGGAAFVRGAGAASRITSDGDVEIVANAGGDRDSCCSNPAIGGAGFGGNAALEATDGAVILVRNDVDVEAIGRGGFGFVGGNGFGGTASVLSSAADINIRRDLTVTAASHGGILRNDGPSIGTGNGLGGGTARLDIATLGGVAGRVGAGSVTLDATGTGGQDLDCGECNQIGGSAAGGTVIAGIDGRLTGFDDGATAVAPTSLALDARGLGGDGAEGLIGSSGRGGSATVDFRGGTNQLAALSIDASGRGGRGGEVFNSEAPSPDGGAGGSGTGGAVNLLANGGTANIAALSANAAGQGGSGADGRSRFFSNGGDGGAGGRGGDGAGGVVRVNAAAGALALPRTTLEAGGRGGDGGDGSTADFDGVVNGAGGAGGNGRGGTAEIGTSGGGLTIRETIEDGYGPRTFGPTLDAEGEGGSGGFGGSAEDGYGAAGGVGGAGGSGTGGIALALVAGGTLTTGPTEFRADGFGGNAGPGGIGPQGIAAADGSGGAGTGGRAELRVADGAGGLAGSALLGATDIGASGEAGSGTTQGAARSGAITIRESAVAGSLAVDRLDAFARGGNAAGHLSFTLATDSGPIRIAGNARIAVDQDASFAGTGTGSLAATGDISVDAGGVILLAQSAAPAGASLLNARDARLTAVGSILGATGGVTATRDVILRAGGAIQLGFAQAGDDINALARGGGIAIGTARTTGFGPDLSETGYGPGDGSNIVLDATGGIRLDAGEAPGRIALTARGAQIDSAGLLKARRLDASAATNIAITDADVIETLTLATPNGFVAARNLESDGDISVTARDRVSIAAAAAGGSIAATASAGPLSLATGTAGGDILLRASGDIAATSLTAGDDVEATSTAGGIAIGSARANGPDIGDIVLDAARGIRLDNGEAVGRIALAARGGQIDSAGLLRARQLEATAATNIAITDADTIETLTLATPNGFVTARNLDSDGDIAITARDQVAVASASAGRDISATSTASTTALTTGNAGRDILLDAATNVRLDNGISANRIALTARGGQIDSAGLLRARRLDASAGTNIALTDADVVETLTLATPAGFVTARTLASDGDVAIAARDRIAVAAATAGRDIVLDGGIVRLDDGDAAAAIRLTARAGSVDSDGALRATDLSISAATDIALADLDIANDINLRADNGAITGRDTFRSGGAISLDAFETIDIDRIEAGQSISVRTERSAIIDTATAGRDVAIAARDIALADAGAGRDVDLNAPGAIVVGTAQAGDDFSATAGTFTGTSVTATGRGPDSERIGSITAQAVGAAGSNIAVDTTGALALARAVAPGTIRLTSAGGAASADAVTAGTDVRIAGAGGVTARAIDAAGGVDLRAANGAVLVSNDVKTGGAIDAAGRAVTLNAAGALNVRNATASTGNVALSSAGNLTIENASATGNVAASSGDALALNGVVDGAQIALASRDIAVGASGRIGTIARTTAIEITANGGAVTVGGSGGQGGYRLDNAELGRFAARDIAIRNASPGAGVQIETVTLRGSAAASPNLTGRLSIVGAGDVTMAGKLAIESAGAANGVRVTAGNAFVADAATAGIALANGAEPTGSIDIDARAITIASPAAATEVAAAPTIRARSDRLGQNDGAENGGGALAAGSIRLAAADRIHVQNSGLNSRRPDDRAGLTAGAGGITLVSIGTAPLEVIINGRQQNGATLVTGRALIPTLTLRNAEGGAASIADGSTVNGCPIFGGPCGFEGLATPAVQDVIEDLIGENGDGSLSRPPLLSFGQLISIEGGPVLPVIDDPVTGTGNDDIYLSAEALDPTCQDERENCAIDRPVTGSGNEELQRGDDAPPASVAQPPASTTIDAPVTGSGNEALQDDDGEDER